MNVRFTMVIAVLILAATQVGCAGQNSLSRQPRVSAPVMLERCNGPCVQTVTDGRGLIGNQMKAMFYTQPMANGYTMTQVAVDSVSPGIVNTLLPVVVGGGIGLITARENRGSITINNRGGDASAQTQTGVDVIQNPGDPNVDIDDIHLDPAPPGN